MHSINDLRVSAKRVLGKICLTVLLATFGLSAKAAVPSLAVNFDDTPEAAGSGPTVDIGWRFSITSAINVTQLGFWDGSGDGLGEPHVVSIWNTSGPGDLGSALVTGTVPEGTGSPFAPGSLFRMVDVTSTLLPAGDYVIGARVPGVLIDTFKDGSVVNLVVGPGINYIEKRFGGGPSISRPDNTGAGLGIFGPNFTYTVPEPSSMALGALCLAGVAGCGWRRRKQSH